MQLPPRFQDCWHRSSVQVRPFLPIACGWMRTVHQDLMHLLMCVFSLGILAANGQSPILPIRDSLVAEKALRPQVAVSNKGSYVVTWYDYLPLDADRDLNGPRSPWNARLYGSGGQPLSSPMEINASDRPLPLGVPSRTVMDEQGNFSCFWMEYSPEANETGAPVAFKIVASRFDSSGQRIVRHEQVKQIDAVAGGPDLADFDVGVTMDGGFVIAWAVSESAIGPSSLMAQRFAQDLSPQGEAIKLNKDPWSEFETHSMVDLAVDKDDSYVVGWLERAFLDLPERTKETFVTMSVTQVTSADRIKTYSRQLARPVAESDDYLPPSIEMVEGKGYFILLPFWQQSGKDSSYSTVLASRYISTTGFQKVNWDMLSGFPIDWASHISGTTTWDQRLVVVFEDQSSRNTRLRVGSLDQSLELGNDEWIDVVSSQAASIRHPEIVARQDGTFVLVFEDVLVDRENTTPQRSVYAGILDLNASPIPVAKPDPYSLRIVRRESDKMTISWQTEAGRTYQLLTGSDVKALQISEEVTGDGSKMQREFILNEHDAFFFTVIGGE